MNKLKEIRERLGKVQAEVAREAGISREAFNAIENGRTALVSKHLDPIATALGVSPIEVLGYDFTPLMQGHLEDLHNYYGEKIQKMEEEFNRERLAMQTELDHTRDMLSSVKHSLELSESINNMLEKQINSSEEGAEQKENV